MKTLVTLALVLALSLCKAADRAPTRQDPAEKGAKALELGAFSVSLSVADLAASRAFYEKLGFASVMGEPAQNWLILRNGTTTIGLFHGMFEGNILTFNPGWSSQAEPLEEFTDVREIQRRLFPCTWTP